MNRQMDEQTEKGQMDRGMGKLRDGWEGRKAYIDAIDNEFHLLLITPAIQFRVNRQNNDHWNQGKT